MRLMKRYVEEFANDMIRNYQNLMKNQDPEVKKLWQEKIDQTAHVKRICEAGLITNLEAIKEITDISDRQIVLKKKVADPVSYYVAECGEFPDLGFYKEVKSLDEAFKIYEKIDHSRMHGGKEIGFKLKDGSLYDDMPCPLVRAGKIDDTFKSIDYFNKNVFVNEAVKKCREMFGE